LNIHPSRTMNSKMFFLLLLCCSLAVGEGLAEDDIALRDGETLSDFLTHETKKWPNGQVKYYIDNSIVSQEHQDLIKDVIGDIEAAAKCINFQDIADEEKVGDHIRISAHGDKSNSGVGCWSYPGRQGDEQVVNLDEDCMKSGLIEHALLHALGQVHEHTRNDRDSFVEIIEENIKHNKAHNFKKREKGDGKNQVAYTDTSYDFFSLLHYPQNAWSKDDKSETIRPINQLYQDIGRSGAMTATDKIDLNLHYECPDIDTYVLLEYVLEVEYRTSMERRKLKEDQTSSSMELKKLKQDQTSSSMELKKLKEDQTRSSMELKKLKDDMFQCKGCKGEKLYTTSTEILYKTRVKIGRKATKEELKKTCQEVGLMPACAYRDNCDYNPTNYCSSVSVETACGGYGGLSGLSGLSGLICNENLAKNCPQLDRIFFSYVSNSFGSAGYVDGQIVYHGKNVVSSVSHPVYSICVTNI